MSLLMDALRRAEQDKKLQEIRARGGSPAANTAPALIDPDAPTMEAPLPASEDILLQAAASQSVIAAARETLALEDAPSNAAVPAPDVLALEPLDDESAKRASPRLDTVAGTSSAPRSADREQTGTIPSARALESDMSAYFDPSRSIEMPPQRVAPEHTLEDLANHTVVDAQTVFAAGQRPRASRLLLAVALLAVVVVTGIGVVAIIYAQRSPGPHFIPPPTVAEGVERPPLRELPIVPQDEAVVSATDSLPRLDTATVAPVPDSSTTNTSLPPLAAAPDPAPAATVAAAPVAPPQSPQTPPAAAAPSVAPLQSSRTPPAAVAPSVAPLQSPQTPPIAAAPPAAPRYSAQTPPATAPAADLAGPIRDVGVGEVRIARAHRPAAIDANLTTAYEAFQAGNLDAAEVRYRAALSAHPGRRDALLGLGAIAVARGDLSAAYRHYADVIERHPDDAVARAALFSLTGADGETGAARLRLLQDAHPEAAYLHFALGNWYARQGRWADAQQAYFEAHARDAANPDYVYNLAICLDRMGQAKAALEYYQKALALADRGAVGFNPTPVLERIRDLGAAVLE